jgi:hypothetical protein
MSASEDPKTLYQSKHEAMLAESKEFADWAASITVDPPTSDPEPVYAGDPRYVELRHMQWDVLEESDGEGRPPIKRYLTSSRYVSTWRLREEGETEPYITIPAVLPPFPEPFHMEREGLHMGMGENRRVFKLDWSKQSDPAADHRNGGLGSQRRHNRSRYFGG